MGKIQVSQKDCVGSSQESVNFSIVPSGAVIVIPLHNTGIQRTCEQFLIFFFSEVSQYWPVGNNTQIKLTLNLANLQALPFSLLWFLNQ